MYPAGPEPMTMRFSVVDGEAMEPNAQQGRFLLFLEREKILKLLKAKGNLARQLRNPDRGVEMMKAPKPSAAPPDSSSPHSFTPDLAALEWTQEGELAAAPRCQMVQRLLEAESLAANQVELIRVSQPWCLKETKKQPPPHHPTKGDGCDV